MKKMIFVIFATMMVANVFGQNYLKAKQTAFEWFKRDLIAPTQFILADAFGNKISVSQLYAEYHKQVIKKHYVLHYHVGKNPRHHDGYVDSVSCQFNESTKSVTVTKKREWDDYEVIYDSVTIWTETIPAYYEVHVTGDGRNRAGGYERMFEVMYVPTYYGVASRSLSFIKSKYKYSGVMMFKKPETEIIKVADLMQYKKVIEANCEMPFTVNCKEVTTNHLAFNVGQNNKNNKKEVKHDLHKESVSEDFYNLDDMYIF